MSTNWTLLAEKENAKAYVLPSGWDSRDTVAVQLDCAPEKVDDVLRPALKSGKVVKQQHRIWDKQLKRVVLVIAYHDTANDATGHSADIDRMACRLAGRIFEAELGGGRRPLQDRDKGNGSGAGEQRSARWL